MLGKLRLGAKLLLAPGAMLVLLAMLLACASAGMARQNRALEDHAHQRAARLKAVSDLMLDLHRAHGAVYRLLAATGAGLPPERRDAMARELRERHAALGRQFARLDGVIGAAAPDSATGGVAPARAAQTLYSQAIADLLDAARRGRAGGPAAGQAGIAGAPALARAEPAFEVAERRLDELARAEQASGERAYAGAQAEWKAMAIAMSVLAALAVGLPLLVTMLLRDAMLAQVREIGAVAADLAEGNLAVRHHAGGRDEIAGVARALDTGIRNLNTMLKSVLTAAQAMDVGARAVAQETANLGRCAQRQAGAFEDAGGVVRDLDAAMARADDDARLAARLSDGAIGYAMHGEDVTRRLALTMDAIRGGSRKVAEMVGAIDGLAFQANMLALNAAAAAALAGARDGGKGGGKDGARNDGPNEARDDKPEDKHGCVPENTGQGAPDDAYTRVASDVLALAQRSAVAAQAVKTLLAEAVAEIDVGRRLVAESGENMARILAAVRQTGELAAGIHAAGAARSRGLQNMQRALLDADRTAREHLALALQAATAANGLRRKAAHLAEAAAGFRLEGHAGATQARHADGAPRVARLRLASVRK